MGTYIPADRGGGVLTFEPMGEGVLNQHPMGGGTYPDQNGGTWVHQGSYPPSKVLKCWLLAFPYKPKKVFLFYTFQLCLRNRWIQLRRPWTNLRLMQSSFHSIILLRMMSMKEYKKVYTLRVFGVFWKPSIRHSIFVVKSTQFIWLLLSFVFTFKELFTIAYAR